MEKRMRKYINAASAIALIALLVFAVGCSTDKGSTPGGGDTQDVGSMQIVLGDDTLEYLPGDSASTTVSIIVRDRQGLVQPGIKVAIALANPQLGLIEFVDTGLRDTTNQLGRVECIYRSYAQPGDNIINAASGGVNTTAAIVIRQAVNVVCQLNLVVDRDNLLVADNSEDSVGVEVRITNCTGAGIPNINLDLHASLGRFTPFPATDASGRARTYWFSNGQYGLAQLSVSAANLTDTVTVQVDRLQGDRGILTLATDVRRIKADGCVSYASLQATLEDPFGTAIVGDTVWFGAPGIGSVSAWDLTDTLGRATAVFCEYDQPNDPDNLTDSAIVVARYPQWGLTDTIRIRVDEAAVVEDVQIRAAFTAGVAGMDSVSLDAEVYYDDGSRVSGLWMRFYKECGDFTYDSVRLDNGGLVDPQFWKFCNQVTPVGQYAEVFATVNGVQSNTILFQVDPGPARRVSIAVDNPVIPINTTTLVTAEVRDSLQNLVRGGVSLVFWSSAGTLSPPSPVPTDINGRAQVTLAPGPVAGPVTVKVNLGVEADSTVVTVVSGDVSTIQLSVLPPSIQVRGTGGVSSAQLRATLYDANNNPAPDGIWVTFEVLGGQPGGGININNSGFQDSAQTANGIAVATVNAGTVAGPFAVRACANDESGNLICASSSNGSVVAGPPAAINISVDEVADDAGGAEWNLEVAAEVLDIYSNAVRCSTAVFFSVDPDTAIIVSELVFTCNPDANAISRPGTAYTTLQYGSVATFETVFITARTAAPNAVSEDIEFILPLQEPTLDLICAPISWDFSESGNPSQINCQATVRDGHNVAINNARVVFLTQRGRLYNQATGGTQIVGGRRLTGPNGSDPSNGLGQCFVWLRGDVAEVFPSPLIAEITCEVRAEVERYGDALDAVIVNFQR